MISPAKLAVDLVAILAIERTVSKRTVATVSLASKSLKMKNMGLVGDALAAMRRITTQTHSHQTLMMVQTTGKIRKKVVKILYLLMTGRLVQKSMSISSASLPEFSRQKACKKRRWLNQTQKHKLLQMLTNNDCISLHLLKA